MNTCHCGKPATHRLALYHDQPIVFCERHAGRLLLRGFEMVRLDQSRLDRALDDLDRLLKREARK